MREDGPRHRGPVDVVQTASREKIQTVPGFGRGRHFKINPWLPDVQYGLEQKPVPILDILSHRVQIGRIVHCGRENAFAVFSLGLSKQLFPPLPEGVQRGFVIGEDLNAVSAPQQQISHRRIL
jgi:hypothetical protein